MPNFIIENINNELVISHRILAEQVFEFDSRKKSDRDTQLKNKINQVKELILDHKTDFEEFGQLRFETATVRNSVGAVNEEKTYFLNEPQATLLLTFMRNNEIVKNFKIKLVKEFFKMRHQLQISKTEKPKNLISVSDSELDRELKTLKFILDNFNLSEKEKIEFINQTLEKINFQTLEIQPKRKTEPVFTLTQLLEDFQISFSPYEINLKLQSYGILQKVGGYWFLKNLNFGVNESYENHTNPKYYKSTFQELLDIFL